MDFNTSMDRRDALKGIGMGVAACVFCRCSHLHAAEKKVVRPPNTCDKWLDEKIDGICDQSQKDEEPCLIATCPGNKRYVARKYLKRDGAPANVCGQWSDPERSGVCMVSIRDVQPCLYKRCPAHNKHV